MAEQTADLSADKSSAAENAVETVLLLDFYGELLTERQRRFCELHWDDDYSITEIAELEGVSRQGVWDILRRAEAALRGFEEKTGIVRRYLDRRAEIESLCVRLGEMLPDSGEAQEVLTRLRGLMV